ncbi:MAG: extracellular solute-binding protein [Armatimonadetes bacterium]|nr:extracellular solute-binding protein [Armatimonadota bacterium]
MRAISRVWVAVACTIAAVCHAQSPKPLTVWGLASGPDSKGLEAVIAEFERRNPDLRIKSTKMGSGDMNPQKLMTAIVGNVPPDVIAQDRFALSDWASRGAFRPLDDLIARDHDKDPLCPKPDQYYPAAWQETQYEGKTYGIPTGADDRILYWNRGIFRRHADELRKAGLDPERAPRTWTELLAYGKILTERDKRGNMTVAGFIPNFGNSWLYLYSFQMNASFMSADGKKCTLYSPQAEEALKFMVKGYEQLGGYDEAQKFQSGFLANENDAFIVGKVAMKIDGDWIMMSLSRYAPDLDFGVAPPPVPDDRYNKKGAFANEKDTFVTWIGGFSYAIPAGAKNVEGAWRFIKFFTSTEARLIEARAQANYERSRGRVHIPRIQGQREANAAYLKEFTPKNPNFAAALAMHVKLADVGRIRPPTMVGQTLWSEHVKALETACKLEKSPKDALLISQAAVQRDLDAHLRYETLKPFDFRPPAAVIIGLLVLLAIWSVWKFKSLKLGRLERQEAKWGYLLISPWLIGFMVFTFGPMMASLLMSFTQYNALSEARAVGFGNYAEMLSGDRESVLKAFGNVFYLTGIGVPLGIVTGLAVALLLNQAFKGIRVYRTIFYMPSIVPAIASAVLWSWVLSGDPNKGLVNSLWQNTLTPWLGVSPPGWFTVADWAKPSLIMMGVWGAGGGMILWLAGLKGVPAQLYEAAHIDGANGWQQFWKVTLPMLSPIVFFNCVTGLISAVQEFDRIWVFMGADTGLAGPSDSLLTPVVHLFQQGFRFFKLGYASALAWVVFFVILALTLIQWRLKDRWVYVEADK